MNIGGYKDVISVYYPFNNRLIIVFMSINQCVECGTTLFGRSDKKFCNNYCRSTYNHKKYEERNKIVRNIDTILKKNRNILKRFNPTGLSEVKPSDLEKDGFNFNYFTNYWKNQNNQVYLLCYEYGYRKIKNGTKVLIILWQEYLKYK